MDWITPHFFYSVFQLVNFLLRKFTGVAPSACGVEFLFVQALLLVVFQFKCHFLRKYFSVTQICSGFLISYYHCTMSFSFVTFITVAINSQSSFS